MSWFKRRPKVEQAPAPEDAAEDEEAADQDDTADQDDAADGSDGVFLCCMCGRPLGFDPEDSLDAEGPGRHLCGNCYRSREWDHIQAFEQGF